MRVIVNKYLFDMADKYQRQLWDEFCRRRTEAGYHMTIKARNESRPRRYIYEVWTINGERIAETGEILHDWVVYGRNSIKAGYWLELDGEPPLPAPVKSEPVTMLSRTMQAVDWLFDAPGRTQTEAAEKFGIRQATISKALMPHRLIILKCAMRWMEADPARTIEATIARYGLTYEEVHNEMYRRRVRAQLDRQSKPTNGRF